jgi:prevent-host-death family protein
MSIAFESPTMGVYEAKTHFASVIERVLAGEIITITKHGHPVAVIEPFAEQTPDVQSLIERTERARQLLAIDTKDIRKLIGRDDH